MTKKKSGTNVAKLPAQDNKSKTNKPKTDIDAVPKDELERAVGIQLHFQGFDFGLKTTSRAIAAADRLLGGVIGLPAAYAEGWRSQAEGKFRAPAERVYPELPEPVVRRIIAEELRKQENLEAVWAEAKKTLLETAQTNKEAADNGPNEVSPDWMNYFSSFAEKASSETIRPLWGRILAGEIRHPSSFSVSALRVLSEIDAETAKAFQEIAEFRISGKTFGFSEDLLVKARPVSGLPLVTLTRLEEAGLLHGASSMLHSPFQVKEAEPYCLSLTPGFGLMLTAKNKGASLKIDLIKITQVGSQICSILPRDEMEACRRTAQLLNADVKIELIKIVGRANSQIISIPLELIKE